MTPRIYASIVTAVILGIGVGVAIDHYRDLRRAAAEGALAIKNAETTQAINKDGIETRKERQQVEIVVRQARDQYRIDYQQEKDNDPYIADRAERVRPERLRNLARERRLARERSAGDGREREGER